MDKIKNFKVSYPYPLGYPIKVVITRLNVRALVGWLYQRYADSPKAEEILVSERIVELPLLHQWFGSFSANATRQVLEIGHVASSVSLELASLGHEVTGIDLRVYPFNHKNLKSVTGDFLTHNFSSKFDFIYTLSAIEHFGFTQRYDGKKDVDNHLDEEAFAKIARLLKSSGRAVVSVPYQRELSKSVWFRIYTREELKRKLGKHFSIVEQRFYQRQDGQWSE
ncbi:MAG: methyltransferase domain-containing protein, partial [bacterium]|nr:methyltransferase domain-containing protein [bacterium]